LSETETTVRILIRKGLTINTDNSNRSYLRVERGVEFDASVGDVNTQCRLWKNWIEQELADELKGITQAEHVPPVVQPAVTLTAQDTVTVQPATPGSAIDDPYAQLPWQQSKKQPHLAMIRVSSGLTASGRELYEKLKGAERKTLRKGNATYKLWVTDDDTEFLQRWCKSRGGT